MARVFIVDGREFPDPDPTMEPAEVKKLWADFMPELLNADIKEHTRGEDTLYELIRKVGTKG